MLTKKLKLLTKILSTHVCKNVTKKNLSITKNLTGIYVC